MLTIPAPRPEWRVEAKPSSKEVKDISILRWCHGVSNRNEENKGKEKPGNEMKLVSPLRLEYLQDDLALPEALQGLSIHRSSEGSSLVPFCQMKRAHRVGVVP